MNLIAICKRESIWYRKALLIDIIHNSYAIGNEHWTIKDTAHLLGMSTGLISEDLRLATAVRENVELEKLSRNLVLKRLGILK